MKALKLSEGVSMSTMSSEKIAGRLQFVGLGINMVIFGAFGMWTVVVVAGILLVPAAIACRS
jgi:hypothetical protein